MKRLIVFLCLLAAPASAQQGTAVGPYISPVNPSFSTSVTTPLLIGGTGAASTLTLESTSGAGTTDAIIGLTGSQVERFRVTTGGLFNIGPAVAPDSLLTLNLNTSTSLALSLPSIMHLIGGNAVSAVISMDSYAGANIVLGRRAAGTQASSTAVGAASQLFLFGGLAYDGSQYNTNASIDFFTFNAQTVSDRSGYIRFRTTPSGSTTLTESGRWQNSGGLTIGSSTTDPGVGGLQLDGQGFVPNMASDSGIADSTVCTATTGGKLLKGTGTLGICLGTSGRQFKTAFTPMIAGMDEIAQLKLWNYHYKPGYGDGGTRIQFGPTAQDVEAVIPELVGHDVDGNAINYDIGAFVPISLHALQQLNDRVKRLEAK